MFARLNTATLAPMPTASDAIETKANIGARRSARAASTKLVDERTSDAGAESEMSAECFCIAKYFVLTSQ